MTVYLSFFRTLFFSLSICFLSGCITRAKQYPQAAKPSTPQLTKTSMTVKKLSLVEGLKSDARDLTKVLKQIKSTEAQDLAILATGVQQSKSEDIKKFLDSEYLGAAIREELAQKDKLAGLVLLGLGLTTTAISSGMLAKTPIRKSLWSSLGFGIAGIVVGSRLFASPNQKTRKDAETLGLSAASLMGIFAISTMITSSIAMNASSPQSLEDLAKVLPKSTPRLQKVLRTNGMHHSADFLLLIKNRSAIQELQNVLAIKTLSANNKTTKVKLREILELATATPAVRTQTVNKILQDAADNPPPQALQKAQAAAKSLQKKPLDDFRKPHGNPSWTFSKRYKGRGVRKIAASAGVIGLALGVGISSSMAFGLTAEGQDQVASILNQMSRRVSEYRSLYGKITT